MRQVDVTEADIRNVVGIWQTCMEVAEAGDLDKLAAQPVWRLFGAEQRLLTAACTYLGMPPPKSVSFSHLDAVDEACECEAIIFWATKPTAPLDTDCFVAGMATRLLSYRWPGTDLTVNRNEHVRYVIWRMSLLKTAMDKEAPECISRR